MPSFLEKVTEGINKGVATVGANSKAMMEKARINTVISNLENEQKQLTQLLGQRVYELFNANNNISADDGIANFVVEIAKRLNLLPNKRNR